MKILVTALMIPECLEELKSYFSQVIYQPWTIKEAGGGFDQFEILGMLNTYVPDALITELDDINANVLNSYQNLKFIGDCRANPANIDMEVCRDLGIEVLCTPARNAQAVAELLVGLLINFYRNVQKSIKWIADGKWIQGGDAPYNLFMGNELLGKKIGFVGFGAVGQAAAHILEGFGCKISFYDPYVDAVENAYKCCDIETIFTDNDVISIHLPVLDSTLKMIDKNLLEMMKEDAVFVNTARSAVVDMEALQNILENKRIKGAILDVLDNEPPTPKDLEITELPNVLLTPHICGASFEVTTHQSFIMNEKIKQWIKRNPLEKGFL